MYHVPVCMHDLETCYTSDRWNKNYQPHRHLHNIKHCSGLIIMPQITILKPEICKKRKKHMPQQRTRLVQILKYSVRNIIIITKVFTYFLLDYFIIK